VLEAFLSRSDGEENRQGDTETARSEPYYHDYTTGTTEGGFPKGEDVRNVRTSAELRGILYLGPHTLTVGGRYEENRVDLTETMPEPGIMGRLSDSEYFSEYLVNDLRGRRNRIPAVYLQDSWNATDRLTVNAGVRWEAQYLYGIGDSIAQSFTNQWQPRLGVTFQPGRLGSQKIFGFIGRFYQQRPLFSTLAIFSERRDVFSLYSGDPRDPNVPVDTQFVFIDHVTKMDDLNGEYFDEVSLGYEAVVAGRLRLLARGVHRVLRDAWGVGFDSEGNWAAGNLGKGDLSYMPLPQRKYSALELTAEHRGGTPLYFLVSYVLSRSHGNYTGLYTSDTGVDAPDMNRMMRCGEQGINSMGLLPNDRTHVFKAIGSYRFNFGLSAGTFFTWQSGTPLNEFGPGPPACFGGVTTPIFLVPRGTAGRLPSIWDLSFRFAYPLGPWGRAGLRSRLVLDILHIGSEREVVVVDQLRLLDVEGGVENPTFGARLVSQPPMTVRLGLEISF
jgi:hypothetical protein